MLDEYETTEFFEMVFLSYKGFPYDLDKENPRRVKAIFKGDIRLIKSLLETFWAGSNEQNLLNRSIQMKRELWVGNKYNPNFYKEYGKNKKTEN